MRLGRLKFWTMFLRVTLVWKIGTQAQNIFFIKLKSVVCLVNVNINTKPHSYAGTSSRHLRALRITIFILIIGKVRIHTYSPQHRHAAPTPQGDYPNTHIPSHELMQGECPIIPTFFKDVPSSVPCLQWEERERKEEEGPWKPEELGRAWQVGDSRGPPV